MEFRDTTLGSASKTVIERLESKVLRMIVDAPRRYVPNYVIRTDVKVADDQEVIRDLASRYASGPKMPKPEDRPTGIEDKIPETRKEADSVR